MTSPNTYAAAGVDINAGQRAVDLMSKAVRATYGPEVLSGIGAFGGLPIASQAVKKSGGDRVACPNGVGDFDLV